MCSTMVGTLPYCYYSIVGPSEAMSNVVIDRRASTIMNSLEKLSLMKRLIENISTDKRSTSEKKPMKQRTSLKERKDKRRTLR